MKQALIISFIHVISLAGFTTASESTGVTLGGDIGEAADKCAARFQFAPFDSLPWLRADLTNEKVSEFDEADWGHVLKRPFKNYSGDISGRFIEIMAMRSQEGLPVHPDFKQLLSETPKLQRAGGYFCASGAIDWQQPIDHPKKGQYPLGSRMLPALWGNARLLCGLVETMRAFPEDQAIANSAKSLGDFYISVLPRFNDPTKIEEYTAGGTYAAGYVTCWFPAMEGLVKLSNITGDKKYLTAAESMADFYQRFDTIPVDHAHGMLCNYVSLALLYQATKKPEYLERVEKRWDELVKGGYINPAGGILEKCRVNFVRDEGCAIDDWLRLNFALADITGNNRYLSMAERTMHNHLLQNQASKGGFGHRHILCDEVGAYGFAKDIEESTWCCSFHGELGFTLIRRHIVSRKDDALTCHMSLDFTAVDKIGTTTSILRPGQESNEVLRQRISLTNQPAALISIRKPDWADEVKAITSTGDSITLSEKDGYVRTEKPVKELEFIFIGKLYTENRRCERIQITPDKKESFVIGYGPKILAKKSTTISAVTFPLTLESLEAQGIRPLSSETRRDTYSFVFKSDR